MEGGSLVVEGLPRAPLTLLAGAERAKVLGGGRCLVGEKLHHHPPRRRSADRDVEVNPRVNTHF